MDCTTGENAQSGIPSSLLLSHCLRLCSRLLVITRDWFLQHVHCGAIPINHNDAQSSSVAVIQPPSHALPQERQSLPDDMLHVQICAAGMMDVNFVESLLFLVNGSQDKPSKSLPSSGVCALVPLCSFSFVMTSSRRRAMLSETLPVATHDIYFHHDEPCGVFNMTLYVCVFRVRAGAHA